MRKRTLFDHYLDAVRLLARAEIHIGFLVGDQETGEPRKSLELSKELQGEILQFLNKKLPREPL